MAFCAFPYMLWLGKSCLTDEVQESHDESGTIVHHYGDSPSCWTNIFFFINPYVVQMFPEATTIDYYRSQFFPVFPTTSTSYVSLPNTFLNVVSFQPFG